MKLLPGVRAPNEEATFVFVLHYEDLEIGRLKVENGEWQFAYSDTFKSQDELKPLTDFPYVDRVYSDHDLWPFFSLRIPSLKQRSVKEFMQAKQIDEPDEATLLERFGRRTASNPYELVPEPVS